jgi:hypothetical protein
MCSVPNELALVVRRPFLKENWSIQKTRLSNLQSIARTNSGPGFTWALGRHGLLLVALCLAWTASTASLLAGNLYVPNASFESVATQFADPRVDSWQKAAQPPGFNTNVFGGWENLVGVFANSAATNAEHIGNALGNQSAFLFSYPQASLFQDYDSVDWSNAAPSHAFNSKFAVGKSYTLTVGVTSSSEEPLASGATLLLSLYYRDASSNQVTVAATTVTYQTNVFTNLTRLIDFQVKVPMVKPADAWAGQNIGIEIQSTAAPNLIGGVWDLDNVRLTENIGIPNASFESVATQLADPRLDSWEKAVQPATFNTNLFGAWDNLSGVFLNTSVTNADHIDNADGNQLAFLFAYPQAALFQDYDSIDWSSAPPTHDFNATYNPGSSYTLTVGLTSSSEESLTQGSTLLLSLYYRDATSNMITVASSTVTFDTNVFTALTHLLNFQVNVPPVKPSDPWAGQHIGIQFESTVPPNLLGGVWDLDNVRLTEFAAPSLITPRLLNGQLTFTIQSEPGQILDIQAGTDPTQSASAWSTIGSVTNTTGMSLFKDSAGNLDHRFYRAQSR